MVLGVDDYRQEFAYHSARDKWIVRDFLGYGTLSGLAVSLEDTEDGPRVRVTPGAAAAPSGQLICVGREQCGSLNAWLARTETKDKLKPLDGAVDPNHAALNLYLTLCYVDCAVADVPIPGEPCRSDENLMAPSRIADDYALTFAFEPPPMAEAAAVDALDTLWHNVAVGGVVNSPAAFDDAIRKAELQLRMALGLFPADAPAPPPADLLQIDVPAEAVPRFRASVRTLWVTRLRPLVAAQSCAAETLPAQDCVLLAQLRLPIVRPPGGQWQVDGTMTAITRDETSRPVLLSASLAQTSFGAEVSRQQIDQADPLVTVITAAGNIAASTRIAIVRPAAAIEVKLPVGGPPSAGRELTVKNGGAFDVTLTTPANTKVEGKDMLKLEPTQSVSLVCDGNKGWHVTGRVQ
jgi:hypothetical protein